MVSKVAGACAGALAIGALLAPGAGAAGFTAYTEGQPKSAPAVSTKGAAGGQAFDTGPFETYCAAGRSSGLAKEGSGFLSDSVKLTRCNTIITLRSGDRLELPAKFTAPLQLLYEANYARIGVIAADAIEIKPLRCTIGIPSQFLLPVAPGGPGKQLLPFVDLSVPAKNLHRFPSGLQEKLKIKEESGGFATFSGNCGQSPSGALTYTGTRLVEVPKGSLGWAPEGASLQESPVFALPVLPQGWAQHEQWIGLQSELAKEGWNPVEYEEMPTKEGGVEPTGGP